MFSAQPNIAVGYMRYMEFAIIYISLSGFCRPDILGDERMLTLREEILNLLESPELLEYLLSNPEKLCGFDYANIIAGAPIGLFEKRVLLGKLKNSAELCREPDKVADYIAALDSATAALENSGNETVLSVVLRRCGVDSFVDGAYYAASAESARRAIREYVSECSDCDWGHMYWEMKLYLRSDASESGGFMRTGYTYIAEPNGEIQYFLHNYGRGNKYYTREEEAFGERAADLNLPVPYRPGDILKIDCSPYTDGVHYCILTEVGDDCCDVRCMYPVFDGRIGQGALKHGDYISENACGIKQYLSPLYRARICVEELPESCRFMKSLRVKLRSNPDFGKAISQVGSYLRFRQP